MSADHLGNVGQLAAETDILSGQRANKARERDEAIRNAYAESATIAELSRATGLTRTMLYKIINKEEA